MGSLAGIKAVSRGRGKGGGERVEGIEKRLILASFYFASPLSLFFDEGVVRGSGELSTGWAG